MEMKFSKKNLAVSLMTLIAIVAIMLGTVFISGCNGRGKLNYDKERGGIAVEKVENAQYTPDIDKYLSINSCSFFTSNEIGVEIFTILPKNSDNAVEDAPIIWFITSQTALIFISFSSNSSSGISIPISISTITFTSCLLRSMTFSPSRPAT